MAVLNAPPSPYAKYSNQPLSPYANYSNQPSSPYAKYSNQPVAGRDGLTQRVACIREVLALDAGLSMPAALREASRMMGTSADGSLPEQAQRLYTMLGLS